MAYTFTALYEECHPAAVDAQEVPAHPVGTTGIWLGSARARDPAFLAAQRITFIVSIMTNWERERHVARRYPALPGNVEEYALVCDDAVEESAKRQMQRHVRDAAARLSAARAPSPGHPGGHVCLVHCVMGISRSATLVMAYLMRHCAHTAQEAFTAVEMARPCVAPNRTFQLVLSEYEDELNRERDIV